MKWKLHVRVSRLEQRKHIHTKASTQTFLTALLVATPNGNNVGVFQCMKGQTHRGASIPWTTTQQHKGTTY
jgi:hypothetical protein